MIYHYDLHLHSVLSPCADCLMTPNNIFNMAMLKKLDIIAVTDHNSMKQLPVCVELAKSYDILFIPGVELTLSEGYDVLIYFKFYEDAIAFDKILETLLIKESLDETYYGTQLIMNIYDEITDKYPFLLIKPLHLSIKELKDLLHPYETLVVIPHIERQPQQILNDLSYIDVAAIESKYSKKINNYPILHNSDAHQITDMNECHINNEINLDNLTIETFFKYFKHD